VRDEIPRVAQVALRRLAPDLLIENGMLIDVYSGRLLPAHTVAVADGLVAWTGPAVEAPEPGSSTVVIEAGGAFISPGFVDAHGHGEFLVTPTELAAAILPLGTTAMLSDTHDLVCALGELGLDMFLKTTASIPFRYYLTLPLHCPPEPEIEGRDLLPLERVAAYAGHPRVLSVSEIFAWPRLLQGDPVMLAKLDSARRAGLRAEGHTPGCSADRLAALAGLGLTSCHESVTEDDVLERLRFGYWTMLRSGSIRSDLPQLAGAITGNPGLDTSRFILTPDWVSPQDVLRRGYLDHVVGLAVERGIPAVTAVQMATLNPATYLGLDGRLGGLAPGRVADVLIIDDLARPRPRAVICRGRLVAEHGRLREQERESSVSMGAVPISSWPAVRVPADPVEPGHFVLEGGRSCSAAELPVIFMKNKTITRLEYQRVALSNGVIQDRPDLLLASIWSASTGGWLTVPLGGFGAGVGGVVLSAVHENGVPLVVGNDPADMAVAVRRMKEIGGGVIIADGGRVVCELPLDVGGVMSTLPFAEVAALMDGVNRYLQERGCPFDDPFFGLNFLSFTGLPYARLTPEGVYETGRGLVGYPLVC